jgi:IS30 family transposase
MRTYTQLTSEQRYQIYVLVKMKHSQTEIAQLLKVNKSTVSRELSRNKGGRGYRAKQAHEKALARRCKVRPRIDEATWKTVDEKLQEDWSPEQISGWLKRWGGPRVSHEWIYQHVLADKQTGGDLYRHLRCQKKRRKRFGRPERRGKLPNRVGIDVRPAVVERRERLGDWEIDTIIGKNLPALVSMVERKSKYTVLRPVKRCQAELVEQATVSGLQPIADQVQTLTSDNGKEFARHQQIADALQADFYFAHPYAAWERGTNENTNGLIRQYFPKGSDLSTVTEASARAVATKLNQRPRKNLDFKTPIEVFFDAPVALMT